MSALKNIALTDYVDVLNEKAKEVNKYEGMFPSRYLVSANNSSEMTLKVVSTTGEVDGYSFELKISKLNPYDKNWFTHAAEAQIAVYQSIIDVIKEMNKNNKFFTLEQDGKYHYSTKKTPNNNLVQQETDLAQLTTFTTLNKFRNFAIGDLVKPKKQETIASIKEKTNNLVNSIRDSIARMRFIDSTPDFNLSAVIKEDSTQVEVSLNNSKIVSFTSNWKDIDIDSAYDRLVSLSYVNRAISNTLEFYQSIIGITDPKLFVSRMFSKKWKITNAGQQYMTCLEIVNLIKEIFNFSQVK